MADKDFDFTDAALIGQVVSISVLMKMVERDVISSADAAELLDDSLLRLEEWQAIFPDHESYFVSARGFLLELVTAVRSKMKIPPE